MWRRVQHSMLIIMNASRIFFMIFYRLFRLLTHMYVNWNMYSLTHINYVHIRTDYGGQRAWKGWCPIRSAHINNSSPQMHGWKNTVSIQWRVFRTMHVARMIRQRMNLILCAPIRNSSEFVLNMIQSNFQCQHHKSSNEIIPTIITTFFKLEIQSDSHVRKRSKWPSITFITFRHSWVQWKCINIFICPDLLSLIHPIQVCMSVSGVSVRE